MSEEFRSRRVLQPEDIKASGTFLVPVYEDRAKLRKWIATNTSGRFFIGQGFVTFEDEADVLMFKLGPHYDRDRVKKAENNRPKWSYY